MRPSETRTDYGGTFQERAVMTIARVLRKRGINAPFESEGDTRYIEFAWNGATYTLAVFAGELNMREGKSLYECYLKDEFASEETYIRSFCLRLDRFLQDGEWKTPQERS